MKKIIISLISLIFLSSCTFIMDIEGYCGNSIVDEDEECDGENLNGETCESVISGSQGVLQCKTDCTFDTTACGVWK